MLCIVLLGSAASGKADERRIEVRNARHLPQILYEVYRVERPSMTLAYRLIEAEILKRNGLSKIRARRELVFPDLTDLLSGAGLPDKIRPEVAMIVSAYESLIDEGRPRSEEGAAFSKVAAQLDESVVSLSIKVGARRLTATMHQLDNARFTLRKLAELGSSVRGAAASKPFVSARRSILRSLANLWVWWLDESRSPSN